MDIIELIRRCQLKYLTREKLIDSIAKLTGEKITLVEQEVDSLISNGDLFVDDRNRVAISADRGLYKGKLAVSKKGYGFLKLDNNEELFISQSGLNSALDGDVCLAEEISKQGGEIQARIVKVINRSNMRIVGTYIVGKSKNVVFPDNIKFPQIRIYKGDAANAQNNDKVWVELDYETVTENTIRGKIVEILGRTGNPKTEQLAIIRSFNLFETFDEKVLKEAGAINQNVLLKNFKKRRDFTKQNVITIDGEDARDFDDAIAVERLPKGGYNLYVHIADVSNYVVENSALDKEAYRRGTSVYFPNMVIPMLPKELSNGVCSLKEGENRLTLSVIISLDKDCNVLDSEITEGIIKSKHRMTYTEVENILKGDPLLTEKYSDVVDDIFTYQHISNALKAKRRARGEIRLSMPEPYILESDNGEIVSIEKRIQDESHEIIESLMVLCNECVAKTFYDLRLPFVYRVHEKPDEAKVERLAMILKNLKIKNTLKSSPDMPMTYQKIVDNVKGTTKEEIIAKLVLRSMMKARYASLCLGHFGLASEFYCHFTSPIRRYPDLMIHRIIKEYLKVKDKFEVKEKFAGIVDRVSDNSSAAERNADEAERTVDDYKKAVFMKKFLGEEFDGIISGVQEYGIFVELDNGVEGLVKFENLPNDTYSYDPDAMLIVGEEHRFTIGDKVKVIVSNVNTELRQIDFELSGNFERNGKTFRPKNDKNKKSKKTKNYNKKTNRKRRR